MRLLASLLLTCAALSAGPRFTFHVLGEDRGSWPELLSSIGLAEGDQGADVIVAPHGTDLPAAEWKSRVERGTLLVLEGESRLSEAFGFHPSQEPHLSVQSVADVRAPDLRIVWKNALDLPVFRLPSQARVFARERWNKAPLLAGYRTGAGAVLWIAAPPGANGYDRFPYLLHALIDLGLEPPFQSRRLWAFFDSAYRSRVDLDYFASRWRTEGISALHVAAWHFWERDPQNDEYLRSLIEACHRSGILVYAWFELPHVSEKFWADHPEWREKTALLQDAQLDWRKLMNLSNPSAHAAISAGMHDLVARFDWDGVNLAELYFESLEGHDNPARFTPMNDDVRAEFRRDSGFDPLDLFQNASPRYWTRNSAGLARFLDYRADLARRQQALWIEEVEKMRQAKPYLDLALTHIDDRFDPTMREKLGADASRVLPMLNQHDFTLLIEDPATIWNQGPRRYPQIAARYAPLTPAQGKLAIDVNIVDRYQDVYPTKALAASELMETIHMASNAFARVALYFESSISHADAALLASASSSVERVLPGSGNVVVQSKRGVGVVWKKPAVVDGKPWPVADGSVVWLPSGAHSLEVGSAPASMRILDFNGDLRDASTGVDGSIEILYESSSRALAIVEPTPSSLEIDGQPTPLELFGKSVVLPRGRHRAVLGAGLESFRSSPNTRSAR